MFFRRHPAYKLTMGPEVKTEMPRDFYLLAMLINSLIYGINNCTRVESKRKSILQLIKALQFLNKFHTAREASFLVVQAPEMPRIQETVVASTATESDDTTTDSASLIDAPDADGNSETSDPSIINGFSSPRSNTASSLSSMMNNEADAERQTPTKAIDTSLVKLSIQTRFVFDHLRYITVLKVLDIDDERQRANNLQPYLALFCITPEEPGGNFTPDRQRVYALNYGYYSDSSIFLPFTARIQKVETALNSDSMLLNLLGLFNGQISAGRLGDFSLNAIYQPS